VKEVGSDMVVIERAKVLWEGERWSYDRDEERGYKVPVEAVEDELVERGD
jgi:hypothetical protein